MRFTIFLVIAISLSSCYKDIEIPPSEPLVVVQEVPRSTYETGLLGITTNSDQSVSTDYSLHVNSESFAVKTENFYEELSDIKKKGQLIEVVKDGRLAGLSYNYLLENDINKIELRVLEGFVENDYNNGRNELVGEEVFSFEYNGAFMSLNNTEFTNDISYQSNKITDKNLLNAIASSGYLKDGTLVSLIPESVYTLSFYSQSERVFTDSNIGSKVITDLPDGQSLFVFHREFGYWLELNQVDGEYLADQLDHFAIADYREAVYVEGTFEVDEKPVSYGSGSNSYGEKEYSFISTAYGQWAQVLPQNEALTTNLFTPCGDNVYSISNAIEATNISDLAINIEDTDVALSIGAQVLDCDGNTAELPTYKFDFSNTNSEIYAFADSEKEHTVLVCDDSFELTGYDLMDETQGPVTQWLRSESANIGLLTSCAEYQEGYSYLQIRDEKRVYPAFNYETVNGETIITSEDGSFLFRLQGQMSGIYVNQQVGINMNDARFGKDGYVIDCDRGADGCGLETIAVTHFDDSTEGWLRVSFSGVVWMRTINNPKVGDFPVSGVILIKT